MKRAPLLKWRYLPVLGVAILAGGQATCVQAKDTTFFMTAEPVEQLLQAAGEHDEDFRIRVFQRMRKFTKVTGHEASGYFCKGPQGRHGISIVTWQAHFSAPAMKGCPLALGGKVTFGEYVHTHPEPGRYTLTPQDLYVINHGRRFFKKTAGSTQRVSPYGATAFSPEDYRVGPGWLVSDGVVMYQQGRGTARVVMRLPALE